MRTMCGDACSREYSDIVSQGPISRRSSNRLSKVRVWLAIGFLVCATDASAQRIIHDEARDKSAQDAAAAAKEVASGALFAKMLANVDVQAHREVDTTMAFVEQQMRAKLENFSRWTDPTDPAQIATVLPGGAGILQRRCRSLRCELESLKVKLTFFLRASPTLSKDELAARLKTLDDKKAALEAALKQLRESAKDKDPAIVRAFDLLEDPGKDIVDYAKRIGAVVDANGVPLQGVSKALGQISDGLDEVLALYQAIAGIWKGYKAISVDPASLRPPQEELDLRLLAVEQDHLKTVARIGARRDMDTGLALRHVEAALGRMTGANLMSSTARIEDTLRTQAANPDPGRESLRTTLDLLHEAAAAVAEEDAAGRLAELRLSDEERRLSILRSAVNGSAYDQTIQAAAQRLALYWKSGVKPADIAQLAFYLTNTIAIPAIALK
jgi:hypothetical protein